MEWRFVMGINDLQSSLFSFIPLPVSLTTNEPKALVPLYQTLQLP